jgi:hypothetical protein
MEGESCRMEYRNWPIAIMKYKNWWVCVLFRGGIPGNFLVVLMEISYQLHVFRWDSNLVPSRYKLGSRFRLAQCKAFIPCRLFRFNDTISVYGDQNHKGSLLVPVLSQMHPVHKFPGCFPKVQFFCRYNSGSWRFQMCFLNFFSVLAHYKGF